MFLQAKPVWCADTENKMNVFCCFELAARLENTSLYIAAADFYRVYVNGQFVAHGPARAAKGYARVDVLPMSLFASGGEDVIRIEVAGYRCRSYATCFSQPFLCAELRREDSVIAYTGGDFTGRISNQKVSMTHRYSVQRHFTEVWDYTLSSAAPIALKEISDPIQFLPRVAPYPHYEDVQAKAICRGILKPGEPMEKNELYCSWLKIPEKWGSFPESEIKYDPLQFILGHKQEITQSDENLSMAAEEGQYFLFDLSKVECGFLKFRGKANKTTELVIGFSEFCENSEFSFFNAVESRNVIQCILPAGFDGDFLSFEPYTARYAIVMVKTGSVTLSDFGIKTYARNMDGVVPRHFQVDKHQKIYEAALRSFAHNAIDIFTDCPSRERAGWLCDSYFTATVEHYLFGKVPTEDAFLDNYLKYENECLPEGALPMCYPADVLDTGTKELLYHPYDDSTPLHIPQWCMWFVLEAYEYLTERTSGEKKPLFRDKIMGVIGYLSAYENEDGLLERLPSWNFVEWSKANQWTMDVNYPTNFLYSEVLLAAYKLYGEEALLEKSKHIQALTRELSFNGKYFTDNAVRDTAGVLQNTGNASEACQYYALLFGGVDLSDRRYAYFREGISNSFAEQKKHSDFVPVNAFLGFYLRLKYLLQEKQYSLVLQEAASFCGEMADLTGTLWEYKEGCGSLDHGFASYVAYAMCVALEHLK